MLLFQKRFHAGLLSGEIRLTFRRWEKTHVRVGGRYRCHPIGVLEVDRVDRVRVAEVTEGDARLAGFTSRAELVAYIATAKADVPLAPDEEIFRVELHHGEDGDRVSIALEDQLAKTDVAAIETKLARLDAKGPWTRKTLLLIEKSPRVAASKLAARIGRETLPFKTDVRKLKKLGLTQSFEVGYEVSPRGRAFLAATRRRPRRAPARS